MRAESTRKRWTYAEFARLPESGSTRHEVIDDELYLTPSPGLGHQRVVKRLVVALHDFVEAHDLGEVFVSPFDVLLGEGDYVEPDVFFVQERHADAVTDRGVEGPPDLVVEVLSPSTEARDRGIKLELYRRYGVPEYWIVDPHEGTVEVWRLGENASEARVIGEGRPLRWQPLAGGPVLEIPTDALFGE